MQELQFYNNKNIIHNFTSTDVGVFYFYFLSKCVKCLTFSILQDYAITDVVALNEDFWLKSAY